MSMNLDEAAECSPIAQRELSALRAKLDRLREAVLAYYKLMPYCWIVKSISDRLHRRIDNANREARAALKGE